MLSEWLDDIKEIGFFLICAQTLIHLRPNGKYVKYLRLLVSIMLLVQILEPFGRVLGVFDKGELQRRVGEMEKKLIQMEQETISTEKNAEDIWHMLLKDIVSLQEAEGVTTESEAE